MRNRNMCKIALKGFNNYIYNAVLLTTMHYLFEIALAICLKLYDLCMRNIHPEAYFVYNYAVFV